MSKETKLILEPITFSKSLKFSKGLNAPIITVPFLIDCNSGLSNIELTVSKISASLSISSLFKTLAPLSI